MTAMPSAEARPGMRLSVHTAVVGEELRSGRVALAQFLRDAARLGCRAAEVDPESARDAAAVRDTASRESWALVYGSDARFPSGGRDADAASAALATAAALGATRMCMWPPHGDPQWTFLDLAQEAGVQVLLTNEPTPGSVARVRALVDAGASPWLQACFDTAAPMLAGENPVRSAYTLNRRIAHVHATDVASLLGRHRRTYPGDGTVWWYGLLWALGALGYHRDLTVVFPGEGRGLALLPLAVDHLTRVYTARFPSRVPWASSARG